MEDPYDRTMVEQLYPDADPIYQIVWFIEWSDYEEDGHLIILNCFGSTFIQRGGHCVYGEDHDSWAPELVTEDEALEELLQWECHLEELPLTYSL